MWLVVVSKQIHDTGEFGSLDLTGNKFVLPGIDNFPCIDSTRYAFKATISPQHPLKHNSFKGNY